MTIESKPLTVLYEYRLSFFFFLPCFPFFLKNTIWHAVRAAIKLGHV